MWRERWSGVPRGIFMAVIAEATVLAYGGLVHLFQFGDGWPPYPWAPAWLTAYFTSLTVLDPLAALLLLARRPAGLYLGSVILVTDAAANWYASYCLPQGTATSRVGQAVISGLALGSLVIARWARPWMRPCRATERQIPT